MLTIDDVTDSLEAGATDGPLVVIEGIGLLMEPEEEDVAADVEDGVDAGGQEGEGERRDSGIHWAEG